MEERLRKLIDYGKSSAQLPSPKRAKTLDGPWSEVRKKVSKPRAYRLGDAEPEYMFRKF